MSGHFLYRAFDADGALLYVGRTKNPWGRMDDHRSKSVWYQQAREISWEPVGSHGAAVIAEREAIQAERPLHNLIHNLADTAAWLRRAFLVGACRLCADDRTAVKHAGSCVDNARLTLATGTACAEGKAHAERVIALAGERGDSFPKDAA